MGEGAVPVPLLRLQPLVAMPWVLDHGCALQELVDESGRVREVRYPIALVFLNIHLRLWADRYNAAVYAIEHDLWLVLMRAPHHVYLAHARPVKCGPFPRHFAANASSRILCS